jgi:hypothetical protein
LQLDGLALEAVVITAKGDGVDCRQAARDYRCKSCDQWIRPGFWLASYELVKRRKDGREVRHEVRLCEPCSISKGLAEGYEPRPRKPVAALVSGDRIVTLYGIREIDRRVRDHADGRPQFRIKSRGQFVGFARFDSEQARVVIA